MNRNGSDNSFDELLLFILGVYGERFFIHLHEFICSMQPEIFSGALLVLIAYYFIFWRNKHQ